MLKAVMLRPKKLLAACGTSKRPPLTEALSEEGRKGIGPSLYGIFGGKSAHQPNFGYGPAMRAAVKTWNEAMFDRHLAHQKVAVAEAQMTIPGIAARAEREAIVGLLRTL